MKLKPAIKRNLKTAYDAACNAYLNALLTMWELDAHYGYWTSDRPGTIYHYGETHNLAMDDIQYIVENDIPEDEVFQWEDYLLDAHEFNFPLPNLDAWHHGCPRTPQSVFDRLRSLKKNLENAIEEEKHRQRGDSPDTASVTINPHTQPPCPMSPADALPPNADDTTENGYVDGTGYHPY